jgi:hypothetical protein
MFTDEDIDLYVWYESIGGPFRGFQLVYNKRGAWRVLTWTAEEGYLHNAVDDGDLTSGGPKRTPILVPDGLLDHRALENRFLQAGTDLPADVTEYVRKKIHDYEQAPESL